MKKDFSLTKRYSRFFHCMLVVAAVCFCATSLSAQSGGITTRDQESKEAMDTALKALGGVDKINSIKSLVIKGSETGFPSGLFETWILLPDSFLHFRGPEAPTPSQRIRHPAWSASRGEMLTATVFFHEGNISYQPITEEQMAEVKARVDETNELYSYLLMGMLAKSGPTPLALSSDSTPGVFILTKNDGSTGEIEFDSKTGYPYVIRYKTLRWNGEMRFNDRFSVNGIMFPRTITITMGDANNSTVRQIDEVQINPNPNLSLKDFVVHQIEKKPPPDPEEVEKYLKRKGIK